MIEARISAAYGRGEPVLSDASFAIAEGEVLGLAGESGSGKSTLALAMMRLLHLRGGQSWGELRLGGRDLFALPEKDMRRLRGRELGLVLQNPMSALNPSLRLETQFAETWRAHAKGPGWRECAAELLEHVSLPADREFLRRFPSEISVGQAQRVYIAMAVMHRPSLLIADEPTSALDVVTQAEILSLFAALARQFAMSVLFISHDLAALATISDRIAVLREGRVVECVPARELFANPRHEYTRRLIAAIPRLPESLAGRAH